MKPKLLFLLKFLGYSFILFIVGHRYFHQYAFVMVEWLKEARYQLPHHIQEFLYGSSMTVVAFLSLILATPKMRILKKAGMICLGIAVFFFVDFFFIQYLKGQSALSEDAVVFELYLCIKWLLPFLLWMLPNYQNMGEFFRPNSEVSPVRD